jgi:hypothetical protein
MRAINGHQRTAKTDQRDLLISVSASSKSFSISARSSYDTGVSSKAAAIAAVVKAYFWIMTSKETVSSWVRGLKSVCGAGRVYLIRLDVTVRDGLAGYSEGCLAMSKSL